MDNIKFYEISNKYIDYLSPHAPHLFLNKKPRQRNERKYIGIILHINNVDYFAPLSSFKPKHKTMDEMLDFIKIKNYAVINLNNMFPVPGGVYSLKNPNTEQNCQYKTLLNNEIRIIKQKSEIIISNAKAVYEHKMTNDGKSKLSQRCNDFKLLEIKCREYKSK